MTSFATAVVSAATSNSATPGPTPPPVGSDFDLDDFQALPQTPWAAFWVSFVVIAVSELGDKTFLISAVLAMRNPRWLVFVAAMSSLTIMTLLAGMLGRVLPTLVSKETTEWVAAVLLIVFGAKMAWDGYHMTGEESKAELADLENDLERDEPDDDSSDHGKFDVEGRSVKSEFKTATGGSGGTALDSSVGRPSLSASARYAPLNSEDLDGRATGDSLDIAIEAARNFTFEEEPEPEPRPSTPLVEPMKAGSNSAVALNPEEPPNQPPLWKRFSKLVPSVFVQCFILTFLAEWGDRSQIATIALAGAHDFWFVMIGALIGHGVCALLAVMGGRFLAERISVKAVTIFGAILLLIFGFAAIFELSFADKDGSAVSSSTVVPANLVTDI
ncbi:hypothetical protein DFJ73DRAFT_766780 [Zopfochytrium polystomum]|nr:hypothetical protein DFJ73DRAFT_766780 [Zopfochytrium polystomum]